MLKAIVKELRQLNEHLEFFRKRIDSYDNACKKNGKVSFGSDKSNFSGRSIRNILGDGHEENV